VEINGPLPTRARIVIIGGGAVGASVGYHLTQLGVQDVILLEQGMLTSGTTWHAVGLIGQLRSTGALTELIKYSTGLYSHLESKTGLATGWKQVGSVMVARTQGRMESLRRMAGLAHSVGVEAEVVDAQTISSMWPVAAIGDLQGGVWLPGDGIVNPTDVTQSMARGMRAEGGKIFEGVRAEGIRVDKGAVTAVCTAEGNIECEVVVNCAGQWAREVGRMAGVSVPVYPVEHMYVVTEAVAGVGRDVPVLRDPDGRIYVREEIGGLIVGGFEPQAKPWRENVPPDFSFQLLEEDWEQFAVLMDSAIHRIPALETTGIKKLYNGPEGFTPDNQFVMGEAPEVRNMYVAAGFNSVGIASAGGAGMALARWIVEGVQPLDLWPVDIRRFAPMHGNADWLRTRVKEAVGHMYEIPWPNLQFHSGRMRRRSPVHHQLVSQGACFGDVMGWELAEWFGPVARDVAIPSFGRQEWFDSVEAEYRSCREQVGICDWSTTGKLRVDGPDASRALDYLCAVDVMRPVGSVVRTPVLNDRGHYESDVVIVRKAEEEFVILTGAARTVRDLAYFGGQLAGGDWNAAVADITQAYGIVGVIGAKSIELLSVLTGLKRVEPLGAIANAREVELGWADALLINGSVLDKAAWMCMVSVDQVSYAYDLISSSAETIGGRPVGHYATESLRHEACSPTWGLDLGIGETPVEAGHGDLVAAGGLREFRGRGALTAAEGKGVQRRLVSLALEDPETMIWGEEPVFRDGVIVGRVSSAAYGYGSLRCLGMAIIKRAEGPIDSVYVEEGHFEVQVGGRRCTAAVWLVGMPTGVSGVFL